MGKTPEIFVAVSPVAVDNKNVESAYQKTMPKVVEKVITGALAKAKSKGIVTKKPKSKDDSFFQLTPSLKVLKNIGKSGETKLRGEIAIGYAETKGGKILAKLVTITEGATVSPGSPPPKNLDADYQAAVEAAAQGAIDKVLKKILGK